MMFVNLFRALFRGAPASDNPWGANTLEWKTSSPPQTHNFKEIPVVTSWPYDFGTKKGSRHE
jgi:cytochrome c oxidase subunit 1